jgi:hypothetical protein
MALAGLSVGGIIGGTMQSEAERQRPRRAFSFNVFANSTWAGILLNQPTNLFVIGAATLVAGDRWRRTVRISFRAAEFYNGAFGMHGALSIWLTI